jgi:NAD(P)-dependent dehydrogenase (short-subunit alcohol dehydrogenase family)
MGRQEVVVMDGTKVAVVTGAGSGIGAGTARMLAARGIRVAAADVDEASAGRTAEAIRDAGGEAIAVPCDVADPQACERLVAETVRAFGGLHIGVNNAGIGGPPALTGEYPLDGWRAVLGVNLDGVFYCMRAQIPAILASGGGAIVNMASILGSVGFASAPAYVAAKHGVVGLTRTAAIEYAAQGLRVNAVGPGFIDTPLLAAADPEVIAGVAGLHPNQRLGRVDEVAELVCFLASDAASLITGAYITADGGYTAK